MKHVLTKVSCSFPSGEKLDLNTADFEKNGFTGCILEEAFCSIPYDPFYEAIGIDPSKEESQFISEAASNALIAYESLVDRGLCGFAQLNPLAVPVAIWNQLKESLLSSPGDEDTLLSEKACEVFSYQLDQLLETYPLLDGFVVPFGSVSINKDFWSESSLSSVARSLDEENCAKAIRSTLEYLTREVCEKRGKILIFQTYAADFDQFHNDYEFYMKVTNELEFSKRLLFSFHHVDGDFSRWLGFNRSLGMSRHSQLVEVDCSRENEGSGALPIYVGKAVAEGFSEMVLKKGVNSIRGSQNWNGFILQGASAKNEGSLNSLWSHLNAYSLAQYAGDPTLSEPVIFRKYVKDHLNLDGDDAVSFRELSVLSEGAVLKTFYCAVYDRNRKSGPVTNRWIRGKELGGLPELIPVFDYIIQNGSIEAILMEKKEAVQEWDALLKIVDSLQCENQKELKHRIQVSVQYGYYLAKIISVSWEVVLRGYSSRWVANVKFENRAELIESFDEAWESYQKLGEDPECPELFVGKYGEIGDPQYSGLNVSVENYRYFGYEV